MPRIMPPMPNGIASISSGHIVPMRSAKPCGVISAIIASKTAHCFCDLGVRVRELVAQRLGGEARQVHDLDVAALRLAADPQLELAAGAQRPGSSRRPTLRASSCLSLPMSAATSGSLSSVSTLPQQCASSRLNGSSTKSALGLALISSRGGS